MSTGNADRAGEPFRCVVCGRADPQCLCRACRLAFTDDGGALAPWVAEARRLAQRLSWREKSAARRGIVLVSFEDLDRDGANDERRRSHG